MESREPDLILETRVQRSQRSLRSLRGHLRLGRRSRVKREAAGEYLRRVQWDGRTQRRGPVEERREEGGVKENPAEAWQQGRGFRRPLNV